MSARTRRAGTSSARSPRGKGRSVDKRQIEEHVAGWYELIRAAVDAADPGHIVQTEAWDLEPLNTWVNGRVVLLGDSAHATTPFASMGACMTIQDCRALVDRLVSDAPLDEALDTYENARKQRDEAVVKRSRRMGKLSMLHSPIASWLRDEAFAHTPEDKMRAVAEEMAKGE
jgi:FAD-dependent urate hydroxylase